MMLHSWNVMYSRKNSANAVNTEKTTNAGVMNAYAVHSCRARRRVARAPRGSRGTGGVTASAATVRLASSSRQDLLGLGGGGVERLVGRLVAVHRLAEVLVERLLDLRPLRIRDHVGHAALHLVGEAGEDRLLLGQLRRVQQRRARRQRRPGRAAERPLLHDLRRGQELDPLPRGVLLLAAG